MHGPDTLHPEPDLQAALERIFGLSKNTPVNFDDAGNYLALLEKLGNPETQLPPVIHVAGTNGKGSVLAFLYAVLNASGYKVHRYTSPHIHRFNERLVLNNQEISDDDLKRYIDLTFEANEGRAVTFFEFTTAMAFKAMAETKADIALIETGMGGRLDCTNVIKSPVVSILTAIGMDHMEYLGDSLPAIIGEKAGIIKLGRPAIVGPQSPQAIKSGLVDMLELRTMALDAPLFIHGREWECRQEKDKIVISREDAHQAFDIPGLAGAHQLENAGTALRALFLLREANGWSIPDKAISEGLANAHWPGRLERVENWENAKKGEIWFDSAHNTLAAEALVTFLSARKAEKKKPVHAVIGMMKRKDATSFLGKLSQCVDKVTCVPLVDEQECYAPEDMQRLWQGISDIEVTTSQSLKQAVEGDDQSSHITIITGSGYLGREIF